MSGSQNFFMLCKRLHILYAEFYFQNSLSISS